MPYNSQTASQFFDESAKFEVTERISELTPLSCVSISAYPTMMTLYAPAADLRRLAAAILASLPQPRTEVTFPEPAVPFRV